jgi:hypothetical protein
MTVPMIVCQHSVVSEKRNTLGERSHPIRCGEHNMLEQKHSCNDCIRLREDHTAHKSL